MSHHTLLAGLFVVLAPTAVAQSLPEWAAPAPAPEAMAMPPTPPGGGAAPVQAPLDGGLGLLALLGGAYAVRRLRAR